MKIKDFKHFLSIKFFWFSKMDKNKCPKMKIRKSFPKKNFCVTIKKIKVRRVKTKYKNCYDNFFNFLEKS